MKTAIFVSGSGTNLQAIIDAVENKTLGNITLQVVISDRDCYGIERAKKHQITHYQLSRGEDLSHRIHRICQEMDVELIVLAGYLSILSEEFCGNWQKKIINLHPSLLPKYGGKGMYGNHVHRAVLAAGEQQSGATVHYVTAGVDEGEIILQSAFDMPENADLAWLQNKISKIEKPLLVQAIKKISES